MPLQEKEKYQLLKELIVVDREEKTSDVFFNSYKTTEKINKVFKSKKTKHIAHSLVGQIEFFNKEFHKFESTEQILRISINQLKLIDPNHILYESLKKNEELIKINYPPTAPLLEIEELVGTKESENKVKKLNNLERTTKKSGDKWRERALSKKESLKLSEIFQRTTVSPSAPVLEEDSLDQKIENYKKRIEEVLKKEEKQPQSGSIRVDTSAPIAPPIEEESDEDLLTSATDEIKSYTEEGQSSASSVDLNQKEEQLEEDQQIAQTKEQEELVSHF